MSKSSFDSKGLTKVPLKRMPQRRARPVRSSEHLAAINLVRKDPNFRRMVTRDPQIASANIDWEAALDQFIEAGSEYGDMAYPGTSEGFKTGRGIYNKYIRPLIFPKRVPKASAPIKKLVQLEKKEAKELAKVESTVLRGTLPQPNRVRKPLQTARTKDYVDIEGCDIVTTITAGTTGLIEGQVMKVIPLNPLTMGAEGLRSQVGRYEEYTFNHLRFEVDSGTGNQIPGTIIHYIDYDPDDLSPSGSGEENARIAITHEGAQITPVYKTWSQTLDPKRVAVKRLFISEDETEKRFTDAGKLVVMCGQPIAANVVPGYLFCHWSVRLYVYSNDNEGVLGDYYLLHSATATTSCTTSAKLGSSTSAVIRNSGLNPISVDYATGAIVLPAGAYMIDTWYSGGSMTVTPGYPDIIGTALYDLAYVWWGGSATAAYEHVYLVSTSSFTYTCAGYITAGTWNARVHIMGMNNGPFGLSLRKLARIEAESAAAARYASLAKQVATCKSLNQESRLMASSSSSTSSVTSGSAASTLSSAASAVSPPGWVRVNSKYC